MNPKHVKIGELEIPKDYFTLDEEQRKEICLEMMDNMLLYINKKISPHINHIDFLDRVLQSSIQSNIQEEKYEICQVLEDIRKLINE